MNQVLKEPDVDTEVAQPDPIRALGEVASILCEIGDIDQPAYPVRAALTIFKQMALHDAMDETEGLSSALYWLSDTALDGLNAQKRELSRALKIAHQFREVKL